MTLFTILFLENGIFFVGYCRCSQRFCCSSFKLFLVAFILVTVIDNDNVDDDEMCRMMMFMIMLNMLGIDDDEIGEGDDDVDN